MVLRNAWRTASAALAALVALALPACGAPGSADRSGRLAVLTAFYPLEYVVRAVGGAHVEVGDLTRPGAEPHDLELTPRDVARVADADLVVYLGGFQPAIDDAVVQGEPAATLDVAASVDLSRPGDPHFWLDPLRLGSAGDAVAAALIRLDPAHGHDYRANATSLHARLAALDGDYQAGLATCARRDLVTSHTAFGYLTDRYGLRQRGVTGLSPEEEPTPDRLAAAADFVKDHHVTTVFFETLAPPTVARALAREAGATTAVLDPVEGPPAGTADYPAAMRRNLAAIRRALGCS